jgi:hypothetical protein
MVVPSVQLGLAGTSHHHRSRRYHRAARASAERQVDPRARATPHRLAGAVIADAAAR